MTNRIRDASKKSEVGRPETEDRSRHGPSARGEPLIRGKPTLGVGVSNSNITDLESPLPENWLQWESRVLAAKKPEDEVGVFIPNRECYAWEEMRELEELHECRNGRKGEENVEYRMMNNEYRSGDLEALKSLSQSAPRNRGFVGRRQAIARGTVFDHWRNAQGGEVNTTLVVPRLKIIQDGAVAWGKKENVEYRMMNNECRSGDSEALKGRKITAQGNALCQENNVNFFAPRSVVIQGGAIAWGKIAKVENCSRLTTTIINMSKKHDLKVFPSRGENPEEKRCQKKNTINKVSITGMRFRVEPGMTATGKTTRLAVSNRLTHNTQPSQLTY